MDECKLAKATDCLLGTEICVNLDAVANPGKRFECKCRNGFRRQNGDKHCSGLPPVPQSLLFPVLRIRADVDECKNATVCDSTTVCVNESPGYRCDCKDNFKPIHGTGITTRVCERSPLSIHTIARTHTLTVHLGAVIDKCIEDPNVCGIDGVCKNADNSHGTRRFFPRVLLTRVFLQATSVCAGPPRFATRITSNDVSVRSHLRSA